VLSELPVVELELVVVELPQPVISALAVITPRLAKLRRVIAGEMQFFIVAPRSRRITQ
jgi:hypothetical protein